MKLISKQYNKKMTCPISQKKKKTEKEKVESKKKKNDTEYRGES